MILYIIIAILTVIALVAIFIAIRNFKERKEIAKMHNEYMRKYILNSNHNKKH